MTGVGTTEVCGLEGVGLSLIYGAAYGAAIISNGALFGDLSTLENGALHE